MWKATLTTILAMLVVAVFMLAFWQTPTTSIENSALVHESEVVPVSVVSATGVQAFAARGAGLGPLPASLADTEVDGELRADADGHLVVNIGVRRTFDYFLSTLGEESLEVIKARIAAWLVEKLPPLAAQEAWQLLLNYLSYQDALSQLPVHERTEKGVREAIKVRQQLRSVWLGPDVAEAFFGFEDALDNFTLARLGVMEDQTLSDEQKQQRIELLSQELPPEVRQAREQASAPVRLSEQVQALREQGGSEAEVRALREQTLGVAAADRLEQLDQERLAWQRRYDRYQQRRAAILGSGLAPSDQQAALAMLQQEMFDAQEVRRVQALDRIAGQQAGAADQGEQSATP